MPARLGVPVKLITFALLSMLIGTSATAGPPSDRVCAPTAMLRVVTAQDVPNVPATHFVRVPKTLYRYGDGLGRVEEALNPETGLHLLIVVAEPHVWMADRASGQGKYVKDPGPTYFFRARIFGDPTIQSAFINSLEFGCETTWLAGAGAVRTQVKHPALGVADRLEYREGHEAVYLYLRTGRPVRLEVHRSGRLYVALDYLQYEPDLPLNRALFEQPAGIQFSGESRP